jgi:hypothetical protein
VGLRDRVRDCRSASISVPGKDRVSDRSDKHVVSIRSLIGGECILVDPASSDMLVSKIKPCMSKHTPINGKAANGSLQQPYFIRSYFPIWITSGNSRANTCLEAETLRNRRIY